jgi:hypothetical protein
MAREFQKRIRFEDAIKEYMQDSFWNVVLINLFGSWSTNG